MKPRSQTLCHYWRQIDFQINLLLLLLLTLWSLVLLRVRPVVADPKKGVEELNWVQ
jgi:hypothetical protein